MLRFLTQSYPEKSKKALGEFLKESSPLTNEEIDTLLSNLSPKIIRDLFVLLKKANLVVIEEKNDTGDSTVRSEVGEKKEPARYLLSEKTAGSGGVGAVYFAYDLKMKRLVAIKNNTDTFSLPHLEALEIEAKQQSATHNSNIITVYDLLKIPDFLSGNRIPYMVMECMDPETSATLQDILSGSSPDTDEIRNSTFELNHSQNTMSRVFTPEAALTIMYDILEVVDLLYKNGKRLHLDWKPENVFLTPEGTKVADFGLLAMSQHSNFQDNLFGSPRYMAPERIRPNEPINLATELYSLSLLLYTLICGSNHPYAEGHHPRAVLIAILTNKPDQHIERKGIVKAYAEKTGLNYEKLLNFFKITLNPINEQRPQTVEEYQDLLENAFSH
ncbi:protein kinase [Candidatus Woesebacteria bacterium]|nr:protein kinase [Candidatus Woesebacteria bacterium]MCD8527472.1 protein kinase [Candidatus Woesebacteria bacterium]MCD8546214.1 protein kinase [Candidatus Woesebacteria bacterium]